MKAKWEILQNWFFPGVFTGWKGLWHITSKCFQCCYSSQKCWLLPVMLVSIISLKVVLWSRTFNGQHDQTFLNIAHISPCLTGEEIGQPLFQLIKESSFQFGFVSSARWTHCTEHGLQSFKIKVYPRPGVEGSIDWEIHNMWDEPWPHWTQGKIYCWLKQTGWFASQFCFWL